MTKILLDLIKVNINKNNINDFKKLDLSPDKKIVNGIRINTAVKKIFKYVLLLCSRKYVIVEKPKQNKKAPTTSSSLKKLTTLVPSGLTLPIIF